jgi:2-dehydro-3-deoxyglucarate aldolase
MGTENTVRSNLVLDTPVFGVRIRSFSTTLLQVLGQVDVDYGYLDLEHAGFSPYDTMELERMQIAANNAGISLVVRIPGSEPSMIRKVLDAGIRTIIIPRIETAGEVKRSIRASRFSYEEKPGKRGFGTAPTNDWGVRPEGYAEDEDASVLVGIMVETAEAVENVQEITSVPGLGFVKIGVGDLSVSLGAPQEYTSSKLQETINSVEKACQSNEIPIGRGVSGIREAQKAINEGYRLIDIGGDVEIFRNTLKERVENIDI